MQEIQVYDEESFVGILKAFSPTYFSFLYSKEWLDSHNSFAIDPALKLTEEEQISNILWGAFCDISPDRWGRIIQDRNNGRKLDEISYMLGVSDYFRVGSLRLKIDNAFVNNSDNIPKLLHLSILEESSLRLEQENYTDDDLRLLLEPGSSLGGARPKASIIDGNILYLAKFYSKNDEYSVILWEKTMFDLAQIANINTAKARVIQSSNPVLLIERFDRKDSARIPFMSAMTLLQTKDGESREKSYVALAHLLDEKNKQELFRRMVFNCLFGNTDDHLRNHALLYDRETKTWNLSPAYDINPNPLPYDKQIHALNFVDYQSRASLQTCIDIRESFAVDSALCKSILQDCLRASENYAKIASNNGIKAQEIKYFLGNFQHRDIDMAREYICKESVENKERIRKRR
ncbi:phosphatidylinositol kinase [Helicobacter cinaedi]|uniref:type II toxin-antitoxin system HipA family toxin n=1 Tax=Helicobacter cinaedi TaxID=213 RepID=UPI001F336A03|nr:type II toxin-antitoxin system HipA family toxin [Helicobacter cinaedi]BDB64187.1 phosphatidylinositol kinase [Helicobacter cinaedi]